jgi:hypothetical protein
MSHPCINSQQISAFPCPLHFHRTLPEEFLCPTLLGMQLPHGALSGFTTQLT